MKHQLLPSPPETAEIKRKASTRWGGGNYFLLWRDKREVWTERKEENNLLLQVCLCDF